MLSGKSDVVKINLDDEEYFLAFAPIAESGWSYAAVAKVSKVLEKAEKSSLNISALALERVSNLASHIKITMFFLIASIVLIFLMATKISQKISNGFVKPLHILTDGVREIANGNFDKKLDIRTNDELEHLADSFNVMTDELKTYMDNLTKMTADKERIATELNVATNIQISMLPRNFNFNRDDFEIYATMHAAKEVGGDFYDFYLLDENHLMITIADVSGKGVPAALFMANSKTILKNFAMTMTNPDDLSAVMKLANDQLCQGNDEMMFVTVFMGLLDLTTGRFIYVNGGHNPPLVYHKSTDQFEYMDVKQNIVLAMMDEMDFEQQEIKLESGDILYLYTDGVTEAMDINNNQYGEERLSNCLNKVDKNADLPTILKNVRDDLSDHVGEADQSDDITMLAVRLKRVML